MALARLGGETQLADEWRLSGQWPGRWDNRADFAMTQTQARRPGPVVFVSTMLSDPWGGSEELWYEAAMNLVKSGVEVRASVGRWAPLHRKVQALQEAGVEMMFRDSYPGRWKKLAHKLMGGKGHPMLAKLERWMREKPPALVVISDGFAMPEPDYTDMFLANGWRYIAVAHSNRDNWWPYPHEIDRYRRAVEKADTMYFVSQANMKLARKQAMFTSENTEIIRNPYGVDRNAPPAWPSAPATERLEMACVGRLDLRTKGQDVLIETLSGDEWRDRNWLLSIYGDGDGRPLIEKMIRDAGLEERVLLKGHTKISDIWATQHLLVQPSRSEGLPITIVEAMMSGRPVLTTDIAGNPELLEDGVSGFIAGAPTISQLSLTLERMWAERGALEQMGSKARAAVLKEIPENPGALFADKIREKIGLGR